MSQSQLQNVQNQPKMHVRTLARRAITLIEVMIVMFLIALIAGVVAYNYRGSLEAGKAFTTEQNIAKLRNLLDLEAAKTNADPRSVTMNWQGLLQRSPLVKNADALMKDGWGQTFTVDYNDQKKDYQITSERYDTYLREHPEHVSQK